jgi:hypothetical protein
MAPEELLYIIQVLSDWSSERNQTREMAKTFHHRDLCFPGGVFACPKSELGIRWEGRDGPAHHEERNSASRGRKRTWTVVWRGSPWSLFDPQRHRRANFCCDAETG